MREVRQIERLLIGKGFSLAATRASDILDRNDCKTIKSCWDSFDKGLFILDPRFPSSKTIPVKEALHGIHAKVSAHKKRRTPRRVANSTRRPRG